MPGKTRQRMNDCPSSTSMSVDASIPGRDTAFSVQVKGYGQHDMRAFQPTAFCRAGHLARSSKGGAVQIIITSTAAQAGLYNLPLCAQCQFNTGIAFFVHMSGHAGVTPGRRRAVRGGGRMRADRSWHLCHRSLPPVTRGLLLSATLRGDRMNGRKP